VQRQGPKRDSYRYEESALKFLGAGHNDSRPGLGVYVHQLLTEHNRIPFFFAFLTTINCYPISEGHQEQAEER